MSEPAAGGEPMRERMTTAVLSVLQPDGMPIFEWGHETTPTDDEMRALAGDIVDAVVAGFTEHHFHRYDDIAGHPASDCPDGPHDWCNAAFIEQVEGVA